MEKNIEKKREHDTLHQKLLQLEKDNFLLLEKIKMARLDGDVSEDGNLTSLLRKN
jgi:hypothetical protein